MAKTQDKVTPEKEAKESKPKKEPKNKASGVLVGRVKKVVKKSRRKLGDEKFEKQLQRTILFLEGLQSKLGESKTAKSEKSVNPEKKPKTKPTSKKAKTKSTTNNSGESGK